MSVDHARLPRAAAVPSLVRWGLSPDADLTHRMLTTFGPQGVADLARDLGISIRRVRSALEELAVVRGVSRRQGEARWRASPAVTLVAELRRRQPRVVDMAEYARRHQGVLGSVGVYPARLRAKQLTGRAIARQRIAELSSVTRREHLAAQPERSFAPDVAAAALPLDRQLLARGVRVRTCGVPPEDGDMSCAAAQELARLGTDYRERAEVPLKMIVFDRRVALLPVDPLDLDAGALEIDHAGVVAALVVLFDQLWSTATDPRTHGVPPIVLTPREQTIVGLLAEGHTDSSVANKLGISQRTIAYALRALMDRIGVENRFQLGLALGATRVVSLPNTTGGNV